MGALNRRLARLEARPPEAEQIIEAKERLQRGEPTDDLAPRAVELGRGLVEAIARAEHAMRVEPEEGGWPPC